MVRRVVLVTLRHDLSTGEPDRLGVPPTSMARLSSPSTVGINGVCFKKVN